MIRRLVLTAGIALAVSTGCSRDPETAGPTEPPFDDSPIVEHTDTAPPAVPQATPAAAEAAPEGDDNLFYANDFDAEAVGPVAGDAVLVLDGDWRVVAAPDGIGKYLELPGDPIREMGLLLGPDVPGAISITVRAQASAQGRAKPRFGVGLNGAGGYKLRVVPARKIVELTKGEEVVGTVPFVWESDRWLRLSLTMRPTADGCELVGLATTAAGEARISWSDTEVPFGGQAALYATPYASTPIRFDDVRITRPE